MKASYSIETLYFKMSNMFFSKVNFIKLQIENWLHMFL